MRDLCRLSGLDDELRVNGVCQMRTRVIQGFVLATGLAASARRMHALSVSGAVAAALVGTAVHSGMGMRGSITTVGYFVSSSALGRLHRPTRPIQQRGNQRDAVQVLANGGPSALLALLSARNPKLVDGFSTTAFYACLAAAAADTWATEIGTRWGGPPRSIVTGRRTEPGESGAVTFAGLAASLGASLAVAALAPTGPEGRHYRAIGCLVGGVAGSLADSLLGALVQERRWCESCCAITELTVHTCGCRTRSISGLRSVSNDAVNLMAVTAGGLAAVAVTEALSKLTPRHGSRVEFVPTLTNSRVPGHIGAS